jgi:hypothetical protein
MTNDRSNSKEVQMKQEQSGYSIKRINAAAFKTMPTIAFTFLIAPAFRQITFHAKVIASCTS